MSQLVTRSPIEAAWWWGGVKVAWRIPGGLELTGSVGVPVIVGTTAHRDQCEGHRHAAPHLLFSSKA